VLVLEDSLADYIFLSRIVPLSLSVLKLIKKRGVPFNAIVNFEEGKFNSLLLGLSRDKSISIKKIPEKVSNFISKKSKNTFEEIRRELDLCKEHDIKCLSYFDKNFPNLLKKIKLPPKLIFIKGSIKPEDEKAVPINRTREPTQYGEEMTRKIAKRFTELGFTIVSGFAKGVDTIAIKTALDNGGRAIGVIASGILNLYPKENKVFAEKLIKNGAIISERFPLKNVTKRGLMTRNRITSGLALGNIFVEGTVQSGTKWQLKYGKDQGRIPIAVAPIGDYEQAYIPNLIIDQENGEVINKVEDVNFLAEKLMDKLIERRIMKDGTNPLELKQTNLFKFK